MFANPFNGQFVLDIFGSYPQTINDPLFDGQRIDNKVTGYTTFVEHPTGAYWVGGDLSGRIYKLEHNGNVTTILGPVRDRSKLSIDWDDTTVSDAQIDSTSIIIGTIGTPSFGDFRGVNDLCFDPRDSTHNTLYVAKTIDHMIYKANLSTGVCVRYAGQDGVSGHADGPALSATFNQPFGICMGSDGTLYVADSLNNAIRTVDPTGTTVSTLLGNQQPLNVSPGATITYNVASMTLVSITSGVATIGVVLATPSILTGQMGPLGGCAVSITGAVNSGTAQINNVSFGSTATWFLNGFTDSQHFTIAIPVGSATVGTITGTITLEAYYNDLYSPPGTVSYSGGPQTQYAFFPQAVKFNSKGRLIYGETSTGSVRRIDSCHSDNNPAWLE